MKLGINLDEVEIKTFEPVPGGMYTLRIDNADYEPPRNGGENHLKMVLTVVLGEYEGRKIFKYFNINHANDKAKVIARSELKQLVIATGMNPASCDDTNDFHGKTFIAKIIVRKDDNWGDSNEIKGYQQIATVNASTVAVKTEIQPGIDF